MRQTEAIGAADRLLVAPGPWSGAEPPSPARLPRLALASTVLAAGLVAASVVLELLLLRGPRHGDNPGDVVALAVVFTLAGVLVTRTRPALPAGWVLLVQGLAGAVQALAAAADASHALPARVALVAWLPAYGPVPVLLLLAAGGDAPGRGTLRAARQLLLLVTAGTACLAVGAVLTPRPALGRDPHLSPPAARVALALGLAAAAGCLLALVPVLVVLARRARRGDGSAGALLLGGGATLAGAVLELAGVHGAWVLAVAALPLALLWQSVGRQLWDLDVVLDRTLVATVAGGCLLAVYVATVGAVTAAVGGARPAAPSLAGAAVLALAVAPAYRWASRGTERLLHGRRDDPLLVLGSVLAATTAGTGDVLQRMAADIAVALAVPYVALQLVDGTTASAGRPAATPVRLPLTAGRHPVGEMSVSPRSRRGRLSPADSRLLTVLAGQVATTADTLLLAADLARSRTALVTGREDERLRLRRDLHDGVGPALAGIGMQVRAAARPDLERGAREQLLSDVQGDLRTASREMRRVIDRLRPGGLDAGLRAAVAAEVERTAARGGIVVHLDAPGLLPVLPAAVEVAAYRIAGEALANVLRHSRCTTATVRLCCQEGELLLEVGDDGVGLGGPPTRGRGSGVGTGSMTERAVELGGRLSIEPVVPHGVQVRAAFPLPAGT